MKHPDAPDYAVAVVGCGAMGQGIAQVSAQGGMRTFLYDAREGGAAAAKDRIAGHINRMAEKGRVSETDADAAINRLEVAGTLGDLAECDAVVEAVFEDLDVKRALFAEIEVSVGPECLIASNTSSIPIASIARDCRHRQRIGGLHFFNPVPLMKLVEVIRAAESSDETISNLMALGKRMTRVPVEVKDSPGFLVNMGGRAYTTEALRIVHEGVATPAQVDAVMRDCWGFRMGPFELMDLTGIDVNYPVSQIIWEGYGYDPRIKTSPNHKAMFDAGLYGRKTGQGWFAYADGKPLDRPSPDFETDVAPARKVVLTAGDPSPAQSAATLDPLRSFCEEIGVTPIADDSESPILGAGWGFDCAHIATLAGVDPARLVGVDLAGNQSKRVTLMTPPGGDPSALAAVAAAVSASNRSVTAIKDGPGFVGQRMAGMVANLGCYMAEIGLASPEDIDTAMELGLNYPRGSIALGEDIGADALLSLLGALQTVTGDDRYRPTSWLRRRAQLGLSLYTPN